MMSTPHHPCKIPLSSLSIELTSSEAPIQKKKNPLNINNCDALHAFKHVPNSEHWQVCVQPTFRAGISTVSLTAKEPCRTVPVMTVPWPRMEKQWSTAIRRSPPGSLLGRYVCFFKSWARQAEVQNSVGNVDTQKEYHTYTHTAGQVGLWQRAQHKFFLNRVQGRLSDTKEIAVIARNVVHGFKPFPWTPVGRKSSILEKIRHWCSP